METAGAGEWSPQSPGVGGAMLRAPMGSTRARQGEQRGDIAQSRRRGFCGKHRAGRPSRAGVQVPDPGASLGPHLESVSLWALLWAFTCKDTNDSALQFLSPSAPQSGTSSPALGLLCARICLLEKTRSWPRGPVCCVDTEDLSTHSSVPKVVLLFTFCAIETPHILIPSHN